MENIKSILQNADSILIGAGAGLSTSAGFTYSGPRFQKYFADFEKKYVWKKTGLTGAAIS